MASIEEISKLFDDKFDAWSKTIDEKLIPLSKDIDVINERLDDFVTHDDLTFLHDEVHKLREENKTLREKALHAETQDRRNNLRFLNIPESSDTETWADCEAAVLTVIGKLGIDASTIRVERAHRLGQAAVHRSRHIIVKFLSFKDRELVLQTFYRKRSNVGEVIIREDWPQVVEERRNKLWPYFKAAQSVKDANGKKVKARLAVDKLVIDDKVYTADNTDAIPSQFHPTGTLETTEAVAFFTEHAPLSNMHYSKFSVDSTVYHTVEQCLVHKKVLLFGDVVAADEVMAMSNPKKIKARGNGKRIKNYNHKLWLQRREEIMEKALHAKFTQNPSLKQKLHATGKRIIIEANKYDKFWGAGVSLSDPKLETHPRDLPGKNTLGLLLMRLRANICG